MADDGFDAFCEAQWPRLVAALDLYCGNLSVAEDLAQDALIRVHARWRRVRHMQSPGGFAHRVAINLANSRWRRLGAEQRAYDRLLDAPRPAPDPTDGVAVRQAVAQLPERQRAAVVLRYLVGMSADQTGEVLGISAGAVRALTHRAVEQLRVEFTTPDRVPEGGVR